MSTWAIFWIVLGAIIIISTISYYIFAAKVVKSTVGDSKQTTKIEKPKRDHLGMPLVN